MIQALRPPGVVDGKADKNEQLAWLASKQERVQARKSRTVKKKINVLELEKGIPPSQLVFRELQRPVARVREPFP